MSRAAIICVDDEEIILTSLGEQLKRSLGKYYDIELASNGSEALELCGELEAEGITIALVISDQMMAGMSGDEFLIKLHEDYPKTLKILLTGQARANSVGNIVNKAALYRYITKPWDETDLILTVKEALRRYGQEEQLVRQNILLQQTNNKLSQSLDLLLATFDAADDGILVLDKQDKVVIFNRQFASFWQVGPESMMRDNEQILSLMSAQLIEPIACDREIKHTESDSHKFDLLKLHNGKIFEFYWQIQKLEGEVVGEVWRFRDVTEKEHAKERERNKALHDTLTQLPKRTILTCQLSEAITKAQQNSHMLAVIFVDLDRFKIINDTLGHHIGDLLLKKVVQRLQYCLRGEDLISRWGNDEFSILLPQIQDRKITGEIAIRILESLKSPFKIDKPTNAGERSLSANNRAQKTSISSDEQEPEGKVEERLIHITGSIGIAIYPEHGEDAETLLKNADAALSQAKQLSNNNYQYYDSSRNYQARKLLIVENLLRSALKQDELVLYYQPIVNIITGKIAKMEALLRWKNPQLGLVSPNIFIPLAENNGEIIPIGEWVLKTACAQNKIWQDIGLSPIKISVNLSVKQFQQANLVAIIADILEQTQLAPDYLELEITESVTMNDTASAKAILGELFDMGISLSMDDFGTGYSSLGYLKQFPFSTLKIDRSFIKDLNSSSADLAIIDAILTLGKGLNLNVIAEGIETEELKDLLQDLGCEYIQGYLFSKPLPAIAATKLLKSNMLLRQEIS
ncbi:diguanylate cyclase (GGDEF) domain-containing protein [Xenococcus sp. PCC 7305]|uniref:GGDEF/EAL domain-containing response regulator n=1 Tax=Xenococcus sp. PCC 7305 TaxID=102125 RepID=UPI0002AC7F5B|nr:EAL domain-containing protein [Xenococcus sp. PCC 7305]ELS00834.1 diguanylate cyclase (GGDEF) domain-containing protein [Xenococcus sp. PCC 7305]